MKNKLLLVSSLSIGLGFSSILSAIEFDIDGVGGSDGDLVAFDWAPGNFLAVDSVPVSGLPFTGYYQAELTTLNFDGFNVDVIEGAGGPYEITAWVKLNEVVLSGINLDADPFLELVNFSHIGGTFEIYYDDFSGGTVDANEFTGNSGLGYRDGKMILTGNIRPEQFGALFTADEGAPVALDQFPPNNLPDIFTVDGFGSTEMEIVSKAGDYDTDFFLPNNPNATIFQDFNATLETPFNSVNPSTSIESDGGPIAPNYGPAFTVPGFVDPIVVNGAFDPAVTSPGTQDFHFETDGNASISVPEPTNFALMGLGLMLLGLKGRRKA